MSANTTPAAWRRAYVLGLGLSGRAAARLLRSHGVEVVASDRRGALELALGELASDAGIELRLGHDDAALPSGLDAIVVSPGVAADHPLLSEARRRNVPIVAEVELAFRLLAPENVVVVAITGSNGKSTTTAMTGALLSGAGFA